jgi:hypothetical protein
MGFMLATTAFARARQESLVLLTHVKDDDLGRTKQHPKLGTVTLAEMLHTWAAHDLNHTVQAERALGAAMGYGGEFGQPSVNPLRAPFS